jgi:hypothetical protein
MPEIEKNPEDGHKYTAKNPLVFSGLSFLNLLFDLILQSFQGHNYFWLKEARNATGD